MSSPVTGYLPWLTIILGVGLTVFFFHKVTVGIYNFRYSLFERETYAKWSLLPRHKKESFLDSHRTGEFKLTEASDQMIDEQFSSYLRELRGQMDASGVRDVSSLRDYFEEEMTRRLA